VPSGAKRSIKHTANGERLTANHKGHLSCLPTPQYWQFEGFADSHHGR
jgi:hypothetical protein